MEGYTLDHTRGTTEKWVRESHGCTIERVLDLATGKPYGYASAIAHWYHDGESLTLVHIILSEDEAKYDEVAAAMQTKWQRMLAAMAEP